MPLHRPSDNYVLYARTTTTTMRTMVSTTVWSVNDGLSENLLKPPETSGNLWDPLETSENLRKPTAEVSVRLLAGFWIIYN